MRTLDLLHRWAGGLIGLLLALLGLTGTILVHKDAWVMLPGAGDALVSDVAQVGPAIAGLLADPATRPQSIIFADDDFGLHRLRAGGGAGAYADQSGAIVTRWNSEWARPELWLSDLHQHLMAGDVGETIAGIAALIGLFFIISGIILWWKLRFTFTFRLWPARMTRPAIIRQHRDFGVVMAPLLFLSCLTAVMLTLPPVRDVLLSPFISSAERKAAMAVPAVKGGALAPGLDWAAMLAEARSRFPDGEFRVLTLPRRPGELISLRLRRPMEWLPNGRTMVWFQPETGAVVDTRDAETLPLGARIYNLAYPLHAATVGGLAFRLVMSVSGLALALLGTLAVWTFWFRRPAPQRAPAKRKQATA
jgi:uncharacterized iron-regulated membrane protein